MQQVCKQSIQRLIIEINLKAIHSKVHQKLILVLNRVLLWAESFTKVFYNSLI